MVAGEIDGSEITEMINQFDMRKRYTYNNWDYDIMLEQFGVEYLNESGKCRVFDAEDVDEMFFDEKVNFQTIAQNLYYGGHWDGQRLQSGGFEFWAEHIVVDTDGSWWSLTADDYVGFLKHFINESDFRDWCVDNYHYDEEE